MTWSQVLQLGQEPGCRPSVAGTFMESERRKAVGGSDNGYEGVGDDGGISDAQGDAFCWNRKCKEVGFGEWGSHVGGLCDLGFSDGLKGWAHGGGSSRVYGRQNGEDAVGEKAAEECRSDEERCAAAWWVDAAAVELDGVEEWMDGCLDPD
jgi:hypothetical protein